ncbi:MAG: thiamine biosynthesis protein [Thermodesulfobacteriota bacterium]|nr:thiamine biosynthesis protein [Thermodesulfobacteriota bacterium]
MAEITALALFSGGLDSILACRVIQEQNVHVQAVQFVTPFFHDDLLQQEDEYRSYIKKKYNIDVLIRDITLPYLDMLKKPSHGYGKYFNPCIDCKILMVSEIKKMMADFNAAFIISGEVIGQRPMSQRKDTLRVIERDSDTDLILLRPLCARSQKPTQVELNGVVDRDQLPDFSGRGRSGQIRLAEKLGIRDYPNPAGGCVLADPVLSKRLQKFFKSAREISPEDIRFLLVGRQFLLPHGGWLALGRKQQENSRITALRQSGDYLLNMKDRPGPTGLLRYGHHPEDQKLAAQLVVRYGKKTGGALTAVVVNIEGLNKAFEIKTGSYQDEIGQWLR